MPFLPRSSYVIAVLAALLLWAGKVITVQQTQLDARPLVEDHSVDARSEDVRRGPVRISRTTITAPDGTKTVAQVREVAAEERHTESVVETAHKETPIASRARTRYVGLGVDPLDYARIPRLRAGVTVFGAVDVGVAFDRRFWVEVAYRF